MFCDPHLFQPGARSLLFVLLMVLTALGSAGAVTLVKNGKPASVIVLPANPTVLEQTSAQELQKYVRMMSGAELPIMHEGVLTSYDVILIGRTPETLKLVGGILNREHLGFDGVILRTYPGKLVVAGNEGEGPLYAVYNLLERLGCRFYLPHQYGEVIPEKRTLVIDKLDYVHKPDFAYRDFWNNGNVSPSMAHKDWWTGWQPKVYLGGVGIMHMHNYMYFCPPSKYFAEHPEYFALVTGKDGKMERTDDGQLCLSNPDVVKLAADAAIAAFDNNPGLLAYSLSPNDNWGWCRCDKCKAMDSPDSKIGIAWRVMKFNNEVAEIVAKKHPERYLAYYAYYSNLRPVPVGMKAHPMVMPVMVALADLMHDIYDPYQASTAVTSIHYNNDYRAVFKQWHRIAGPSVVYEWYQLGKAPYLPSPMLYAVGSRIRYYRNEGVIGFSGEVIGRSPVNDLSMYVVSRMLWDANQDPKAMVDEFFALYFAESAGPMREYYRILHETSYFSDNRGCYVPPDAWTPEIIAKLYAKLDEADALARQDIVRKRLDRERKGLTAIDLSAKACRLSKSDGALDETNTAIDKATAYLNSIADDDILAEAHMISGLNGFRKNTPQ